MITIFQQASVRIKMDNERTNEGFFLYDKIIFLDMHDIFSSDTVKFKPRDLDIRK